MAKYVWHFHHDRLLEGLRDTSLKPRREDIRENKAPEEQRLRLALFKLVKAQKAMNGRLSRRKILNLHKKECPDCPWIESWQTIFTHRVPNTYGRYTRWCRPSEGRKIL